MTAAEITTARRLRTLGELILATRKRQVECDRREEAQRAKAIDLVKWTEEVMAAKEDAAEALRIADAAAEANSQWELHLVAREHELAAERSRLAHPANQPPPATGNQEQTP